MGALMSASDFDAQLGQLAKQGLNWAAYVPATQAPATQAPTTQQLAPGQGLLLLLSMGAGFGMQCTPRFGETADPLDDLARTLTQAFIERSLRDNDETSRLLYPQPACRLDLRAWLAAARVQYPSRLGLGIRPDWGTWFAVRAAVCTTLSESQQHALNTRYPALPEGAGPCHTCADSPCIDACPPRAVEASDQLERCTSHRLSTASSCGDRCHSRLSCPVGREHAYPEPLLKYHYGVSLVMLRRWKRS